MDDTPRPKKPQSRALTYVLVAIVLLFTCLAASLLGGIAGYAIGRNTARESAPARGYSGEARPERDLPMPEMPPAAPSMAGWSLVVEVVEDSPADRAGLRVGDIITTVDGEALDEDETLADVIARYEPGDEIELRVMRDGESRAIEVTLDANPEDEDRARLGIVYRPMAAGSDMRFEAPSLNGRSVPWSSQ